MAEKLDEQVSALVDGEAGREELDLLLRRLERDGVLRSTWERYHLIGDAMRSGLPERFALGVAERVSAAIAAEPVLAAPLPQTTVRARRNWTRPAIGLALAASVAGLVLVGVRPAAIGNMPLAGGDTRAALSAQGTGKAVTTAAVARTLQRDRLNAYLVSHNESASRNQMSGVLPYVRMVGYESGR